MNRRSERGSATAEVAILVPTVVLLVGFVVLVGRLSTTQQGVNSASADAARAASIRQDPWAAQADGVAAAAETLGDQRVSCAVLDTSIDTARLEPGGIVTATVTCTVGLGDLLGLGIPGSRQVTSSSSSTVDRYRGGS